MKISQLISTLTSTLDSQGDLEVFIKNYNNTHPLSATRNFLSINLRPTKSYKIEALVLVAGPQFAKEDILEAVGLPPVDELLAEKARPVGRPSNSSKEGMLRLYFKAQHGDWSARDELVKRYGVYKLTGRPDANKLRAALDEFTNRQHYEAFELPRSMWENDEDLDIVRNQIPGYVVDPT